MAIYTSHLLYSLSLLPISLSLFFNILMFFDSDDLVMKNFKILNLSKKKSKREISFIMVNYNRIIWFHKKIS